MTLTRESKVRITSTAPPRTANAIGWCEECGDVEVEPMCWWVSEWMHFRMPVSFHQPGWESWECCHYADCPQCGGDVDQWAWT